MSERAQALEAALRALRNEYHAIKSMSYDEIKASAGYTNLKCWMDRMDEADALLAVPPPPPVGSPTTDLKADDVEWVVNDNAELGVKIGNQFFWCYKGHSLVYETGAHDDGSPMHWRPVFKREFGECIHPINYASPTRIGTVSRDDSDDWQPLLSTPVEPAGASESPSEMDSGIVLLVSAASAASGYLERQQPDLAAWLWNAVQLVLNSQSAPVSPVEPAGASEPPMEREDVGQHQHEFAEVEVCRHCLRTEADIEGTCHHCDEGTGARCWWCFKLKSTPVAPAGASESPSEMDSGIVLLVSAASAASGYLERQQPDLAAWLWNAVQLVLNSQSAPVSPVEPTPEHRAFKDAIARVLCVENEDGPVSEEAIIEAAESTLNQLLESRPVEPTPEPPTEAQWGEYDRLKRQAREIERALREAGCPAMPLEQGVRWLADKDFTAPLPPRPPAVVKPLRYDLVRYGVTWPCVAGEPLLTPMPDGYWTPWHLAVETPTEDEALQEIEALRALGNRLIAERRNDDVKVIAAVVGRFFRSRLKPTGAPAPCVWRDIASAPKDETPIRLKWAGTTVEAIGRWCPAQVLPSGFGRSNYSDDWRDVEGDDVLLLPTHWKPVIVSGSPLKVER